MTYGGGQSVDRRASTRRNVHVLLSINLLNMSPGISGRIQNVSDGGMKVITEVTPAPFNISDEVWFSVSRDYLKFQGEGKILWTSRVDDAVGIKFTQVDKKSRRSLEDFLNLFADGPANNH